MVLWLTNRKRTFEGDEYKRQSDQAGKHNVDAPHKFLSRNARSVLCARPAQTVFVVATSFLFSFFYFLVEVLGVRYEVKMRFTSERNR